MQSKCWRRIAAGVLALVCCADAALVQAQTRVRCVDGVRVGAIQTLGDVRETNPERLLRSLGLERGAPYDSARTEKARRELLDVGWLRSLDLLLSLPAPDSLLIVVVVERAPRARLFPMLDLRADDRVVVGGQLYAWGRSGRGEQFRLRVAGGGQELMQAEWNEPRPFVRLPFGLRFGAELVDEFEEAEGGLEFDRLALHASVSVPHRGPRLELAGSVLQVRASEPEGTIASGGVDHLRRGALDFTWGSRGALFEWSTLRGRVGIGATAGIAAYQDFHVQAQVATRLAARLVVAAGWTYRDVRGLVPRYDRIHLGGGSTLRAHKYAAANGDGGTSGGLELRVPTNFSSPASFRWTPMPVVLYAFWDAGTAWAASAPGAASEAPERGDAKMRWSTGLGLTAYYRHTYPLRLDFGVDDDGVWRGNLATSLPF